MRKYVIVIIVLAVCIKTHAQYAMNKDNLLQLLPFAKEDTAAVQLYINTGQKYNGIDTEAAKYYYRKAGELSKKIHFKKGIIKYISNYTYILNMQGDYDSSFLLNSEAVALCRESGDSINLANTLFNTGTSCRDNGEYEKAIGYYTEGKQVFDKLGITEMDGMGNDFFQLLYYELKQYDKAIEYGERAVAYYRQRNDITGLVGSLNNLGANYSAIKKYKKSVSLYEEALKATGSAVDKTKSAKICNSLAEAYYRQWQ
jgi:two-component system, NarL family, sensor kinase